MSEHMHFRSREEFRDWLECNHLSDEGVWLLFGKSGGPVTVKADEALEEALCFGWIDGQMKRIDDMAYIKYFSMRRKNSNWSDRNKKLAEMLEARGSMTGHGRAKIDEAKRNGQWDAPKAASVTDEQIASLCELLMEYEPAFSNFQGMSLSIKRTYARAYFDAKTDDGRAKRLSWMIERLDKNLKPM